MSTPAEHQGDGVPPVAAPPVTSSPDHNNWTTTLVHAWIENRMELDRTLITLSAGGIGLIVTLLTASTVLWWALPMFAVAIFAFIQAIRVGLAIFRLNADHLEAVITGSTKGVNLDLSGLDVRLRKWFWWGVGCTIAAGALGVVPLISDQEVVMKDRRELIREITQHDGPKDQASLDRITNLGPREPTPSQPANGGSSNDSSTGSGGGNQGGQ